MLLTVGFSSRLATRQKSNRAQDTDGVATRQTTAVQDVNLDLEHALAADLELQPRSLAQLSSLVLQVHLSSQLQLRRRLLRRSALMPPAVAPMATHAWVHLSETAARVQAGVEPQQTIADQRVRRSLETVVATMVLHQAARSHPAQRQPALFAPHLLHRHHQHLNLPCSASTERMFHTR